MSTLAEKLTATQQTTSVKSTVPGPAHFRQIGEVNPFLLLQRTVGNQAIQRLLRANSECLKAGSGITATARFARDLSRIPNYSGLSREIQTKLKVYTARDIYKQEADGVCKQVMRWPEPPLGRACACGGGCSQCQTEHPGREQRLLPTISIKSSDLGRTPNVDEAPHSGGQPFDAFIQSHFGHDFNPVRGHQDARTGNSARALDPPAYTVGRNVVFAPEQYAPGTAGGRQLLSYQLTHVVQEGSAADNSGTVVMRQPKPVKSEFSGCTGNQPRQIDAVVQNAKRALNRAEAIVGSAYGRPSDLKAANRQLLMAHFHTTSRGHLRKILGTYISIGRAFDSGLEFECETTCPTTATGVVCGYAYNTLWFGGIGPIHICFDPASCNFATTAAINQVALVIHEAAHRHAGVDDKKYRWEPDYATLSAQDAMDNADSYAWFAVLV